jgi:hypothetical protein
MTDNCNKEESSYSIECLKNKNKNIYGFFIKYNFICLPLLFTVIQYISSLIYFNFCMQSIITTMIFSHSPFCSNILNILSTASQLYVIFFYGLTTTMLSLLRDLNNTNNSDK